MSKAKFNIEKVGKADIKHTDWLKIFLRLAASNKVTVQKFVHDIRSRYWEKRFSYQMVSKVALWPQRLMTRQQTRLPVNGKSLKIFGK